ncbi:MAG: hypothetical protein HS132_05345 [Planctomycetia bacterium]|nr:hypothetical protein [Planctomycetia bacterium]
MTEERLYTVVEVRKILNIARHRLNYLFDSRRLKDEEFPKLPNGHKVFGQADLAKIRQVLWEVGEK